MAQQLVVQVVLKTSNASSMLKAEEPITAETAIRNKMPAARIQQFREKLSASGFEIVATGPYSLSISGSPELFEKVFETQLRLVPLPGVASAAQAFYQAQEPVRIPEDWLPFVATIIFPAPPALFP